MKFRLHILESECSSKRISRKRVKSLKKDHGDLITLSIELPLKLRPSIDDYEFENLNFSHFLVRLSLKGERSKFPIMNCPETRTRKLEFLIEGT